MGCNFSNLNSLTTHVQGQVLKLFLSSSPILNLDGFVQRMFALLKRTLKGVS